MSLAKQIGIAILATISLLVFGIGSFYASKVVFPDAATPTATPTPTNSTKLTVSQAQDIAPRNISVKQDATSLTVQFSTNQETGAYLYVTPDRTENFMTVITQFGQGVPVKGVWYTATKEASPALSHEATIPTSALAKTGDTYYFILLTYNGFRVPYGLINNYQNGPTSPYILKP